MALGGSSPDRARMEAWWAKPVYAAVRVLAGRNTERLRKGRRRASFRKVKQQQEIPAGWASAMARLLFHLQCLDLYSVLCIIEQRVKPQLSTNDYY